MRVEMAGMRRDAEHYSRQVVNPNQITLFLLKLGECNIHHDPPYNWTNATFTTIQLVTRSYLIRSFFFM